ncbi:hypothetical protein LPJ61_003382 [Coemansia biformis]|uniref:Tubulin-folding cofactor D C-terminal domain-containing protein n=1 Tax=Coemansia biformis TaxID=1286918 RepID=A0A9W7YCN4_9FUNG|nr:hypothetical protein LPJ61_003382 [Coemansia biformis]
MRLIGLVLRSTAEKIDKLREAAGRMLELLLGEQHMSGDGAAADPRASECIGQLRRLVLVDTGGASCRSATLRAAGDSGFSWADPASAYARIAPALSVGDEQLRRALFEGLVVAGAAEPLVVASCATLRQAVLTSEMMFLRPALGRFAVSAVAAYAETPLPVPATTAGGDRAAAGAQPGWGADGIVAELARLLQTDKRTSKVINPALIVADQLIEQGALRAASPSSWVPLYGAVRGVAAGLRAPPRLLLCLKVYGSLALVSGELARLAAGSLLAHTGHPSLKIRQAAADHLFAVVCIHGAADVGDDLGAIEQLLAETEWAQDSAAARDARARLDALLRGHLQ